MFIPHTEKKIWSLHLSNFTFYLVGFFLLLMMAFGFFFSFKLSDRMGDYHYFLEENSYYKNQLEEIHQVLPTITRSQKTLFGKLDKIFLLLGVESDLENSSSQEQEKVDSITRYAGIGEKMENVANYIKSTRNLFQYIPSIFPLVTKSFWYSSPFGYRTHPVLGTRVLHTGQDIATLPGTPILAAADGVVKTSGWAGPYGNAVYLIHQWGYATRYAHMMRTAVGGGAAVKKGQIIGYVGTTGMSTGYHLHYEVILNNELLDPMIYLFLDRFNL